MLREVITFTDTSGVPPTLAEIDRGEMPSTVNTVLNLASRGLVRIESERIAPTSRGRELGR